MITKQLRQLEKIKDRVFKLANPTYERWVTSGDGNVCPLCQELEDLGWCLIADGKLPDFRNAHESPNFGQGEFAADGSWISGWKTPDSSCNCTKIYR